jgi:hypothetical protein
VWADAPEGGAYSRATIRFTHQVDRKGRRVELKTEESKATLPLPRSTALMLLVHKARTRAPTSPRSFVFGTVTGRPLGQRNVLRALYRAQEHARDAEGRPTFPELFEHDEGGCLVVDKAGAYVPRRSSGGSCRRCRISTRSGSQRRWSARTLRRRVTCCGIGTAT